MDVTGISPLGYEERDYYDSKDFKKEIREFQKSKLDSILSSKETFWFFCCYQITLSGSFLSALIPKEIEKIDLHRFRFRSKERENKIRELSDFIFDALNKAISEKRQVTIPNDFLDGRKICQKDLETYIFPFLEEVISRKNVPYTIQTIREIDPSAAKIMTHLSSFSDKLTTISADFALKVNPRVRKNYSVTAISTHGFFKYLVKESSLGASLNAVRKQKERKAREGCDLRIVAEGRPLHAHSFVIHSEKNLRSKIKDSKILIDDFGIETVDLVLDYIYLKNEFEAYLESLNLSIETLKELYKFANIYRLENFLRVVTNAAVRVMSRETAREFEALYAIYCLYDNPLLEERLEGFGFYKRKKHADQSSSSHE